MKPIHPIRPLSLASLLWLVVVPVLMSMSACGDADDNRSDTMTVPFDGFGDGGAVFDVGDCGGDCDDGDPCTDDFCTNGSCTHPQNKAPCDDGDECTGNDRCNGGVCKGTTQTCGDATDSGPTPKGPDLVAGELVITEIHYNPYGSGKVADKNGEWFEIRNETEETIDLTGLVISDDNKDSYVVDGSGTTVAPGAYYVFGRNADETVNGGVKVNHAYAEAINLANSVDAIVLRTNGVVVDQVKWDKSASWPSLNGKAMQLSKDSSTASDNDSPDSWCAATEKMASGDAGTPGKENGLCNALDLDKDGVNDDKDNCPQVANPAQSDQDQNGVGDACEPDAIPGCGDNVKKDSEDCDDGNLWSGDGCSKYCQLEAELKPGALIITEMLPNPATVSDDDGEWIELYNPSDKPVRVNGLRIQVGQAKPYWKPLASLSDILIPAKGYLVVGPEQDKQLNGGAPIDVAYGKLNMANTKQTLKLVSFHKAKQPDQKNELVVVDQVTWDKSTKIPAGASLSLDPTQTSAAANDDMTYWCHGQQVYGDGDLGSPGATNPSCVGWKDDDDGDKIPDLSDNCTKTKNKFQTDTDSDGFGDACDTCPKTANPDQKDSNEDGIGDVCETPYCGNGVIDGSEACDDGNGLPGDGCAPGCSVETPLSFGDLVITELMVDTTAVNDSVGEWIELYNPTTETHDINGVELRQGSKVHVINAGTANLLVAPKSYAVIGINADKQFNGGVAMTYGYSSVSLTNVSGEVQLLWGNTLVDSVKYASKTNGWQSFKAGFSLQLSNDKLNATDNDIGKNWCKSKTPYGAGDIGSPGAANAPCPPDFDGDEYPDATDNCPKIANSSQSDSDKDGVGNACDNCPTKANKDQADDNKDGKGNACSQPPAVCGDKVQQKGETCDDGNQKSGDGCSSTCQLEVTQVKQSGEVVITEILFDSTAVTDPNGEWFELTNPSNNEIDITGWTLADKDTKDVVIGGPNNKVTIPAKSSIVLGLKADKTINGGVTIAFAYPSSIALSNSSKGGKIAIFSKDGTLVDQVQYQTTAGLLGWPGKSAGVAYQLAPAATDASSNDSGAAWCLATKSFGAGDKGTPGAANDATCVAKTGPAPGNAPAPPWYDLPGW